MANNLFSKVKEVLKNLTGKSQNMEQNTDFFDIPRDEEILSKYQAFDIPQNGGMNSHAKTFDIPREGYSTIELGEYGHTEEFRNLKEGELLNAKDLRMGDGFRAPGPEDLAPPVKSFVNDGFRAPGPEDLAPPVKSFVNDGFRAPGPEDLTPQQKLINEIRGMSQQDYDAYMESQDSVKTFSYNKTKENSRGINTFEMSDLDR